MVPSYISINQNITQRAFQKNENMRKIHSLRLWGIFEDRFILEEGVYWRYMTDEKINIDQKEPVR